MQNDLTIKTDFTDKNELIFWLICNNKKVIGFDDYWIQNSKLNDKEIKNLNDEKIGETTIGNNDYREYLIKEYCGSVIML